MSSANNPPKENWTKDLPTANPGAQITWIISLLVSCVGFSLIPLFILSLHLVKFVKDKLRQLRRKIMPQPYEAITYRGSLASSLASILPKGSLKKQSHQLKLQEQQLSQVKPQPETKDEEAQKEKEKVEDHIYQDEAEPKVGLTRTQSGPSQISTAMLARQVQDEDELSTKGNSGITPTHHEENVHRTGTTKGYSKPINTSMEKTQVPPGDIDVEAHKNFLENQTSISFPALVPSTKAAETTCPTTSCIKETTSSPPARVPVLTMERLSVQEIKGSPKCSSSDQTDKHSYKETGTNAKIIDTVSVKIGKCTDERQICTNTDNVSQHPVETETVPGPTSAELPVQTDKKIESQKEAQAVVSTLEKESMGRGTEVGRDESGQVEAQELFPVYSAPTVELNQVLQHGTGSVEAGRRVMGQGEQTKVLAQSLPTTSTPTTDNDQLVKDSGHLDTTGSKIPSWVTSAEESEVDIKIPKAADSMMMLVDDASADEITDDSIVENTVTYIDKDDLYRSKSSTFQQDSPLNDAPQQWGINSSSTRQKSLTSMNQTPGPSTQRHKQENIKCKLLKDKDELDKKLNWLNQEEELFLDRTAGMLAYLTIDKTALQLRLNKTESSKECPATPPCSQKNSKKQSSKSTRDDEKKGRSSRENEK